MVLDPNKADPVLTHPRWRCLNGAWVDPDVRDEVVGFVITLGELTGKTTRELVAAVGIAGAKYHDWRNRHGQPNRHNGQIPKGHWTDSTAVASRQ